MNLGDELNAPIARSGHSAVFYGDFMILFGGIHEITRELNDMYIYNAKRNRWSILFHEK